MDVYSSNVKYHCDMFKIVQNVCQTGNELNKWLKGYLADISAKIDGKPVSHYFTLPDPMFNCVDAVTPSPDTKQHKHPL